MDITGKLHCTSYVSFDFLPHLLPTCCLNGFYIFIWSFTIFVLLLFIFYICISTLLSQPSSKKFPGNSSVSSVYNVRCWCWMTFIENLLLHVWFLEWTLVSLPAEECSGWNYHKTFSLFTKYALPIMDFSRLQKSFLVLVMVKHEMDLNEVNWTPQGLLIGWWFMQ